MLKMNCRFTISEKGSNPAYQLCTLDKSCKTYILCSLEDIEMKQRISPIVYFLHIFYLL